MNNNDGTPYWIHKAAERIADKANECCHRCDGYREDVMAFAVAELRDRPLPIPRLESPKDKPWTPEQSEFFRTVNELELRGLHHTARALLGFYQNIGNPFAPLSK